MADYVAPDQIVQNVYIDSIKAIRVTNTEQSSSSTYSGTTTRINYNSEDEVLSVVNTLTVDGVTTVTEQDFYDTAYVGNRVIARTKLITPVGETII